MAKRLPFLEAVPLILAGVGLTPIACGLDWTVPTSSGDKGGTGGGSVTHHATVGAGWTDDPKTSATSGGAPGSSGDAAGGAGGTGDAGGATSSSGGGAATCDGPGVTCGDCSDCTVDRGCSAEVDACMNDDWCRNLHDCYATCDNQACADGCYYFYGQGQYLYDQAVMCIVCDVCVTSCASRQANWCN